MTIYFLLFYHRRVRKPNSCRALGGISGLQSHGHLKLCMYFPQWRGTFSTQSTEGGSCPQGVAHFAEKLSQQGQYPLGVAISCDGLPQEKAYFALTMLKVPLHMQWAHFVMGYLIGRAYIAPGGAHFSVKSPCRGTLPLGRVLIQFKVLHEGHISQRVPCFMCMGTAANSYYGEVPLQGHCS